jgi:serine/threonine protein kinase
MIPDGRPSPNGAGSPGVDGEGECEDELASVLDAYLAEVEAGRPVDPEDWVRRHPAIAGRLRACLRSLHLVEAAAEALEIASGPAGVAAGRDRRQSGSEPSGPDSDPDLEPDADAPQIGDFRVVREIGRGGMGVVYEAVEGSLGRRVALKVLPLAAAIDPRQIARFRVEAQAASQLHHPHIVPVYSVGCQGGIHYYAMQLIDGPTLAQLIAGLRQGEEDATQFRATSTVPVAERGSGPEIPREGEAPCEPDLESGSDGASPSRRASSSWSLGSTSIRDRSYFREAARLGREAAEALEHAHQQGVLHRDVKPSNLMVDGRGYLWVTDFGLARFQGEASLTAPGDLLGTLRYMSPEQATADHAVIDERTDVYSLGATLYELVTLHPVFAGSDRQELLRRIAQEEPRRPRAIQPAVPRDLETITLKAMAKDPAGRYVTAQQLADDLGRFLDDRPIMARRPGPLERSARWARRYAAALLVAVPLLALTVLALGIAFGMVVAEQARTKQAHDEARRAVDELYTQAADRMGKVPSLHRVQREFLLKALKYYQKFSTEHDEDPALRAEAGKAAFRVGEIQRMLGEPASAEDAYRKAIAVLEAISPVAPGSTAAINVLEWLGRSYGQLGQLLTDSDRSTEARSMLARAVELTRTLAARVSDETSPGARARLTAIHHRLGVLLRLLKRDDEAEAAYRKTIELATGVGGREGLEMRAGLHGNLGQLLSQTDRRGEAERAFREAVDLYESMLKNDPDVPVCRQELADALARLGVLVAKKPGGQAAAEPLLRRALELDEKLVSQSPDVPLFRQQLALTLLDLADVLIAAGRPRDAEPFYWRSIGDLEGLAGSASQGSPPLRRQFAQAIERLAELSLSGQVPARDGRLAPLVRRAVELREALLAEKPDDPAELAALAGALSLMGRFEVACQNGAAARQPLLRAVDLQQQAMRREPAVPEHRHRLLGHRRLLAEVLIVLGAHAEAAAVAADLLRDAPPGAARQHESEHGPAQGPSLDTAAAMIWSRCAEVAARDGSLKPEARAAAVRDDCGLALAALRRAVEAGDDPLAPYLLAWFLANCPAVEHRDPTEAIRIARGILARSPGSWAAWATLGAAQYRADSPHQAVATLEHAAGLNHGDLLHFGFFLAMAQHQLDEPDRARECFDRADRRLQGRPRDDEIRRIRAEAAGLLGLADPGRGPPPQGTPDPRSDP